MLVHNYLNAKRGQLHYSHYEYFKFLRKVMYRVHSLQEAC